MLSHNSQAMTALSTNRQRVLNALQAVEINEVIVRYRGSSDEGDITEIVIPSHDDQSPSALQDQLLAFSFVRGTYRCGAYHYFLVDKPLSLEEALRVFTIMWVDLHHAGWENNQGGEGVMTINSLNDQFLLVHTDYSVPSNDYRYYL